DHGRDAGEYEAPGTLEQLLPEVPAAREPGEAVVEADGEAERRDRVVEDVLIRVEADEDRRPHTGECTHPERRDGRGQVPRVDVAEQLRDRTPLRHGKGGARRREDRRLG